MAPIANDEYKEAVRDSICSACVCFARDRENPSLCVHENSGQCSLFAHLDEVIEVISGVHSDSIETYTEALRQKVCSKCDHQNAQGICDLRDSGGPLPKWCTLDAYFNLVTGVIEDVAARKAEAVS